MSYRPDEPGFPENPYPLEPFDASFAAPAQASQVPEPVVVAHPPVPPDAGRARRLAGALHYLSFVSRVRDAAGQLWSLGACSCQGFWYSGTLLGILGAHEMGHYLLCRRYNVDATLPYFIPCRLHLPDRARSARSSRSASRSRPGRCCSTSASPGRSPVSSCWCRRCSSGMTHVERRSGADRMAASCSWASRCSSGGPWPRSSAPFPDGYTVNIHPMVFAAWFGMLATALNLLPFGQLDGGHITYATLGRLVDADLRSRRSRPPWR